MFGISSDVRRIRLRAPFGFRGALLSPFLALLAGTARAGPVEQLTEVAVHPSDSARLVVRYFNGGDGAFVTTDGGKNWKLLCDSLLFDPATTHGGPLVITAGGTMIMGVFTGMWHDDGHACAWTSEPQYDGQWIAGFAIDPIDPTITYAVTSSGGKQNGIVRRDSTGKWSDFGTKANLLITDIHVVPHAGGRRFYLGTAQGEIVPTDGGSPESNYVVRVSDDDGTTWTDHVYGGADGNFHVQAVDPTNADRIVVSIQRPGDRGPGAENDTVLVSLDQGKTFQNYLTVTEIGGVAFAPDGRMWIGDAGNGLDPKQPQGLFFAASLSVPAQKLPNGNYPVQCLDYDATTSTLYACQRWTFGPVSTADGAFTTSLDVRKVASFVSCPGVDMAATCQTQLCGAYCGLGHFADAPVCCAYDTFSCGPAVAPNAICPPAPTVDAGMDGATGAAGADSGGAVEASTGASGGAPGGDASVGAGGIADSGGNGGAPADASRGKADAQDGGCCAIAGRARSGSDPTAALALVTAALLLRRKRS